ncbi:MAG: hypothetical protein ACPG7F_01225 [Aggregatilineales bacterium]
MYRAIQYSMSLLILICISSALVAQETEDNMPPMRADHIIDTVEIEMTDDGAVLVLTGTLPDGCDIPTQITAERQGAVVYVDIYRDVPPNIACPAMLVNFEERIDVDQWLFTLADDETLPTYLLINDYNAFRLNYAQIEPMPDGADTPPPPAPLLTRMNRIDDAIEQLIVDATDNNHVSLTLTGMRDGCDSEQHVRLVPDMDSDTLMLVEVFHLVFEDQACTRNLVMYEIVLEVDIIIDDAPQFVVAPRSQPTLTNAAGDPIVRSDFVIESIEAVILESDPPQIQLEISGFQSDSCIFSAVFEETREDDTITVHVYREIPITVTCMRQDVSFSETYTLMSDITGNELLTIHVNDMTISVEF